MTPAESYTSDLQLILSNVSFCDYLISFFLFLFLLICAACTLMVWTQLQSNEGGRFSYVQQAYCSVFKYTKYISRTSLSIRKTISYHLYSNKIVSGAVQRLLSLAYVPLSSRTHNLILLFQIFMHGAISFTRYQYVLECGRSKIESLQNILFSVHT